LDLWPWVTRAELAPHFPSTIEPATWNGRVWAMPWLMNVGVLYYRTDLLAKYRLPPPRTWEALVDQVVRVRGAEHDGRLDGVVWQGRQYEGLTVNALEAIWANGGRVFGADGAVFPEEERAAGGLSFLRALIVSGVSPSWVTAADEELGRRHSGDGRAHPDFPVIHDLMLRARPRPVTPAYLMLSTTLQPEFSAALVGVKSPRLAIEHARLRLSYLLEGLR